LTSGVAFFLFVRKCECLKNV